ncbi:MAG: recombinase family protein, partial [Raoultibacter sp.]
LGYDEVKGKLTPNGDAWIVKLLFEQYAAGISISRIIKNLDTAGAKRLHTDKSFTAAIVCQILNNEMYVGDRLIQKEAPHNYLTKRPDPTVSYTHYYIKDDHAPIVDRETWERVRERLKQIGDERTSGLNRRVSAHFLYGLVCCAECGAPYKRRTIKGRDGVSFKMWNCAERQKGARGNGCGNSMIREATLLQSISDSLGLNGTDEGAFSADALKNVQRIEVAKDGVKVILKEAV